MDLAYTLPIVGTLSLAAGVLMPMRDGRHGNRATIQGRGPIRARFLFETAVTESGETTRCGDDLGGDERSRNEQGGDERGRNERGDERGFDEPGGERSGGSPKKWHDVATLPEHRSDAAGSPNERAGFASVATREHRPELAASSENRSEITMSPNDRPGPAFEAACDDRSESPEVLRDRPERIANTNDRPEHATARRDRPEPAVTLDDRPEPAATRADRPEPATPRDDRPQPASTRDGPPEIGFEEYLRRERMPSAVSVRFARALPVVTASDDAACAGATIPAETPLDSLEQPVCEETETDCDPGVAKRRPGALARTIRRFFPKRIASDATRSPSEATDDRTIRPVRGENEDASSFTSCVDAARAADAATATATSPFEASPQSQDDAGLDAATTVLTEPLPGARRASERGETSSSAREFGSQGLDSAARAATSGATSAKTMSDDTAMLDAENGRETAEPGAEEIAFVASAPLGFVEGSHAFRPIAESLRRAGEDVPRIDVGTPAPGLAAIGRPTTASGAAPVSAIVVARSSRTERAASVPVTRLPLRAVVDAVTWPSRAGMANCELAPDRRLARLRTELEGETLTLPIEVVRSAWREERGEARTTALRLLARRDGTADVTVFVEALRDGTEDERAIAIDALAARGAREPIEVALGDRADAIVARAALAVSPSRRLEDHRRILDRHHDPIRRDAILALLAGVLE